MIQLMSARGRLRVALDLLDACQGIGGDEESLDAPLADFMLGRPLAPDHVLHSVPKSWTVRQAIERAADEARHAAQEAVDEVAHAQGWPR